MHAIHRSRNPGFWPAVFTVAATLAAVLFLAPPTSAQQPSDEPAADEPAADEPAADEPTGAAGGEASAPRRGVNPRSVPRVRPGAEREWKQLAVEDDLKRARLDIQNILRAKTFTGNQRQQFEDYYRKFFLPRWTLGANLDSLPGYRKELRNDLLLGRTGPPHALLSEIALEMLSQFSIDEEIHPAVRYNAMLMIGDLNAQEPARSGDEPEPLPAALPVMLRAVQNPDQIDAVRVAALLGLRRYVQLAPPSGEARNRIHQALLELVSSPKPVGRSVEGHGWLRSLAIQILGEIGGTGPNNTVSTALVTVLADNENSLLGTRCDAVEALGRLQYQGGGGFDPLPVFRQIGQLAYRVCKEEVDLGYSGNDAFRGELVKARLTQIDQGLESLARLATRPDEQKLVEATRNFISNSMEVLDDRRLEDQEILDDLDEQLKSFLKTLEAGSKEAAGRAARAASLLG